MHYVIVTVGTRGDVQPFVALGRGLVDAGHRVTIATHTDFASFVEGHGLGFRPIGGSFRERLESPQGRAWIESGDSLRRYMKTFAAYVRPLTEQFVAEVDAAIDGADALLVHPFAFFAVNAARQKKIPFAIASLVPFVKSPEIAPMMFPRAPKWDWLRLFLQRASLEALLEPVADIYTRDTEARGIEPLGKDPWTDLVSDGVPFIHLYSEALLPRPDDWPKHAHVTGFCFLDENEPESIDDDLRRFVEDGEPPIYLGFGSMTGRDPESLTRLALDAVRGAGLRAVIVTGWGGIATEDLPASIHATDSAPHSWLFPRVRAVVHHGGVGTTAAGLRASRPTQIVSFFGDQPYWGRRVELMGMGPRPLHRTKLTARRLEAALTDLVSTPTYAEGAERAGEVVRDEDGVRRAVDVISAELG